MEQDVELLVSDVACERALIGTLMLYDCIDEVRQYLSTDCFTSPTHRNVYLACVAVANNGQEVNFINVNTELQRTGSAIAVTDIIDYPNHAARTALEAPNFALRLQNLAVRRKAWAIGRHLVENGIKETEDIVEVAQRAADELSNLNISDSEGISTLQDAVQGLNEQMKRNAANGGGLTGTNTGFRKLNEKGGLQGSDLIIIAGETSQGKALAMDEPILTVNGWKANKELVIGDELASVDGETSQVVGIYPQGVRDMYEITFTDGRKAKCSDEHLWEVAGSPAWHGRSKVLTTLQIKGLVERKDLLHKVHPYVPSFQGDFGEKKDFVIHPYILGVLIGDGCLTRGATISNADDFVINKVASLCTIDTRIKKYHGDNCCTVRLATRTGISNPYRTELERLGLLNHLAKEKFIPEEYLTTCRKQRVELLNGLMDTDGTIDLNGCISYSTSSLQLAIDVQRLCWSLGYRCSYSAHESAIRGKRYDDHYRVTIAAEDEREIFTLPRRAARVKRRTRVHNCIQSVRYVGKEECQCIKVSHPRELFVIKDYIVTHNTTYALSITRKAIEKHKVAFYSLEMTKEQLAARLLSAESGVPANELLYSGSLSEQQLRDYDAAVGRLPMNNLLFDDRSTSNLDTILASIRKLKREQDIQGAVIDYLQILGINASTKSASKEQLMGDAARRLKNIAKELNIWVIALSQLNRNTQDPVPNLNRLRDSGQIAEAADVVMFVYRPEYYGKQFPEPFASTDPLNKAMIDVAKGRNIGIFKFLVDFNKASASFTDAQDEPIIIGGAPPPTAQYKQNELPF